MVCGIATLSFGLIAIVLYLVLGSILSRAGFTAEERRKYRHDRHPD